MRKANFTALFNRKFKLKSQVINCIFDCRQSHTFRSTTKEHWQKKLTKIDWNLQIATWSFEPTGVNIYFLRRPLTKDDWWQGDRLYENGGFTLKGIQCFPSTLCWRKLKMQQWLSSKILGCTLAWGLYSARERNSHMQWMGMLVGNFEFNP